MKKTLSRAKVSESGLAGSVAMCTGAMVGSPVGLGALLMV
jgi:hypothetical protein